MQKNSARYDILSGRAKREECQETQGGSPGGGILNSSGGFVTEWILVVGHPLAHRNSHEVEECQRNC